MPSEEWVEAVWLDPPAGDEADRHAEIVEALERWLAERGAARADIQDKDLRIDLVYLGPASGGCARRVMVRSAAIPDP